MYCQRSPLSQDLVVKFYWKPNLINNNFFYSFSIECELVVNRHIFISDHGRLFDFICYGTKLDPYIVLQNCRLSEDTSRLLLLDMLKMSICWTILILLNTLERFGKKYSPDKEQILVSSKMGWFSHFLSAWFNK